MKIRKRTAVVILVAIILLTTTHFARKWNDDPCPQVFPAEYSMLPTPLQKKLRARVYLFGSLNVLSGTNFSSSLQDRGFQVIFLPVPQLTPCIYRNDAINYAKSIQKSIRKIKDDVERQFGPAKSIIGGGSIGGLHAMMSYGLIEGFSGWFALMTVTTLTSLTEFSGQKNPRYFDPFVIAAKLKNSVGLITWGTKDTRVDHKKSKQLYESIQSPGVSYIEYEGMAHETTPRQIGDALAWIEANY